jgi:hypothetical protein
LQGCRPRPAFSRWLCVHACGLVPAVASPASGRRLSRRPIRSWALRRSFPVERSRRRAAVEVSALPAGAASPAQSPALQRVVGLMPGRSGDCISPERLPV